MFAIIVAAGWPIWPLIFCSVVAVALVVERFIAFRTEKIIPPSLLDDVLKISRSNPPTLEKIREISQQSLMGNVLADGLQTLCQPTKPSFDELISSLEGAGRRADQILNMRLTALATIASSAPLLGLLGTVVGMIEIFGSQSAGGSANPEQLAHGISIALYNTAFGLIVAIPALVFWRYFKSRANDYLLEMELAADRLARHLRSQFQL